MLHSHFQDHNGQLSKAVAFWRAFGKIRTGLRKQEDQFIHEVESHLSDEEAKEVQSPNESSQRQNKPLMGATKCNTRANTDSISTYGEAITETCYRTLTADRTATGLQPMPYLYLHHMLETQQAFLSQQAQEATDKISSVFQDLMIAIEQATNYRTLFITEAGHSGLGPTTMKTGDEICIILGCSVPLVLRLQDVPQYDRQEQSHLGARLVGLETPSWEVSRPTHHRRRRLIGECYLHGFMDGGAVSKEGWEKDVRTFLVI